MAPDAIIRLIQGTYEIGARIGERKTLPPAYVIKSMNGVTRRVVGIGRQQMLEIEFGRRLEQYPVLIALSPFRCFQRPSGIM